MIGIIKSAMGLRQFLLRGLTQVDWRQALLGQAVLRRTTQKRFNRFVNRTSNASETGFADACWRQLSFCREGRSVVNIRRVDHQFLRIRTLSNRPSGSAFSWSYPMPAALLFRNGGR